MEDANQNANNDVNHKSGLAIGAGGMEELREMLFGNQMREQGERIDSMEKRFASEFSKLRDELHTRLNNETSSIISRLEHLEDRVSSGMSDLRSEIMQQAQRLEEKMNIALTRLENSTVSRASLAEGLGALAEAYEAPVGETISEECDHEQRSI